LLGHGLLLCDFGRIVRAPFIQYVVVRKVFDFQSARRAADAF
jgi:hypothetical protein